MIETSPSDERPRRGRVAWIVVGSLALVVALIAVPLALFAGDGASDDAPTDDRVETPVDEDAALAAVRAAVGQTLAAGSFEMDTVTETSSPSSGCMTRPTTVAAPSSSSECVSFPPPTQRFETHTMVNLEPYAAKSQSQSSSLGPITMHVNSTHVWQQGGANVGYGPGAPGITIDQYVGQVVGTLGRGPGALAMISIASRSGSITLEEAAVATATPSGTGTVGDISVSYFDVTIDYRELTNTPGLSDSQRRTIDTALAMLETSGYSGTEERIGIDEQGFVREVHATTTFADGSTSKRSAVLSNYGCAPKVTMPNEPASTEPPGPCAVGSTTTTTPAETSTSTSTSTSSTTSTVPPSTVTSTSPTTSSTSTTTTTATTTAQ